MTAARAVLGDIPAHLLGAVNYHEHLFQVSPLLRGDELDDEALSADEAVRLRASGFASMIDATPLGLGRRPDAIARISAETGLTVIASTGVHREEHYPADHPLRSLTETELADRLIAEITIGMDDTDIRAGLIKTGIGYWSITAFERTVLAAAATAHRETGAPIMVHLEHGSAAIEVLTLLIAAGVAADAVVLAHADRNPDPVLHAELAAIGAYLGYDGFARSRILPDSALIDCLAQAIELGAGDRIVIGGDVARHSRYIAYGGMPGLQYLGDRILPRLESTLGVEATRRVTTDNPSRLLAHF
ncbi:MAG: aryldialkylphosphatase [Actinobacteria bacterium]|nr:aryldialkylphosphatase [Actinomycetota bacterium]